jgi:hypothetical protein
MDKYIDNTKIKIILIRSIFFLKYIIKNQYNINMACKSNKSTFDINRMIDDMRKLEEVSVMRLGEHELVFNRNSGEWISMCK